MNNLAEALVRARQQGQRLISEFAPALTVEQGYTIQERVQALLGREVAGWKVAKPPGDEVISAPILDDSVFQSGAIVPLDARMSNGFECELAFKVKHQLPVDSQAEYTIDDVLPALGDAFAAIELLSCRTERGFQSPRPLLVADNLGNGGIVLGAPRTDWRGADLSQTGISLHIAGKAVVEKRGGNPIGNPLQAVVLLANHLAHRGRSWCPGQIIMTGAFAGVHHAEAGQRIELHFDGFAPVIMFAEHLNSNTRNDAHVSR
jgi:2-keto-4-pentenoate hydratase